MCVCVCVCVCVCSHYCMHLNSKNIFSMRLSLPLCVIPKLAFNVSKERKTKQNLFHV